MLRSMSNILEVVSLGRQDPMSFETFEPEDVSNYVDLIKRFSLISSINQVIHIWNTEKAGKDALGRGRGRARGLTRGVEELRGQSSGPDWSRSQQVDANDDGGMWDNPTSVVGSNGSLDLADFALAAMKFRSEMETMKARNAGDHLIAAAAEDTMERMVREQLEQSKSASAEDMGIAQGEIIAIEDDDIPDWAADDVPPNAIAAVSQLNIESNTAAPSQPEIKRNLLMEVTHELYPNDRLL